MKLNQIKEPPREIMSLDVQELSTEKAQYLVESFETPIVGYYNWDYRETENRIKKLYELGKKLNWNASLDIDWSIKFPAHEWFNEPEATPFSDLEEYKSLSDEKKLEMDHSNMAWTASQLLHGEQGALLVSSQLVSCSPSYQAKLYAASQAFDEARHVEVFNRYIKERIGYIYPVNKYLKMLLDKILTDPRWDLKFIGMQIIVEGLALAAFESLRNTVRDPVLKEILRLTKRDEARHVTFGVNFLEDFIPLLNEKEKEERAEFALEACMVMKERLFNLVVPSKFLKIKEEKIREILLENTLMGGFRDILFSNIVPNLKRIGLMTEKIRPKFDRLGLLDYESFPHSGEVPLEHLDEPLFEDRRVS